VSHGFLGSGQIGWPGEGLGSLKNVNSWHYDTGVGSVPPTHPPSPPGPHAGMLSDEVFLTDENFQQTCYDKLRTLSHVLSRVASGYLMVLCCDEAVAPGSWGPSRARPAPRPNVF